MDKETKYKINDNGSFTTEETIRTTPQDGVVPESKIRPAAMPQETYGKYHAGYSTTKSYSTNDPRVTRTAALIFCVIFTVIGIIALMLKLWFFGIAFIGAAIFGFVKSKRDIDAIADKLKKQGKDVTIDSKEELKEVVSGVTGDMKTGFQESARETFTDDKIKHFTKLTLPIFCILGVIVSVALSVFVSIPLGIFVLIVFAVCGALYYFVFLKLLVQLFKK